jgi:hypothetical protein
MTPKVKVKKAATVQVVELQLRGAFRHAAKLPEDAEVTIQWFEDGSGIERIFYVEADLSMLLLDFDGAKALCYKVFGGYPEQTEDHIWTEKAVARLWADFALEHNLPADAPYFAGLSDELQELLQEPWDAVYDQGRIITFRQDDPT